MNQQHDHDRIAAMIQTGIPAAIIARRLRCSPKTVRRVASSRRLTLTPIEQAGVIGTPHEALLWENLRSLGQTPARIAYAFGYSRQHLSDYFSQPRQPDALLADFLTS